MSELKRAAFDLGVEYDNLAGDTKPGQALALIDYLAHRQQLNRLAGWVLLYRPDIDINAFVMLESGPQSAPASPGVHPAGTPPTPPKPTGIPSLKARRLWQQVPTRVWITVALAIIVLAVTGIILRLPITSSGIFISIISGANPFTRGSNQSLAYGETITGEIQPAGEIDRYTFQGKKGDEISIVGQTETTAWIKLQLFDPKKKTLNTGSLSSTSKISYTLPEDGIYQVTIEFWEGNLTGAYTLFLKN